MKFFSISTEFMNQLLFIIRLHKTFSFYYCANRNKHRIGQPNKKNLFCSIQQSRLSEILELFLPPFSKARVFYKPDQQQNPPLTAL